MYNKVETNMNFVDREKQTEKFWEDHDIFKKSMEQRKQGETYTFYDGPPTANGKPHIGHVLTRVIKDMIPIRSSRLLCSIFSKISISSRVFILHRWYRSNFGFWPSGPIAVSVSKICWCSVFRRCPVYWWKLDISVIRPTQRFSVKMPIEQNWQNRYIGHLSRIKTSGIEKICPNMSSVRLRYLHRKWYIKCSC